MGIDGWVVDGGGVLLFFFFLGGGWARFTV